MSLPRCSAALLGLMLITALVPAGAQAETRAKAASTAQAKQKVSLLGGKLAFTLPAGYVKTSMPEIDAKAKAQGVSGAMYSFEAQKRVLIVTQTPNPVGVEAADNDTQVLDELTTATLSQQASGYQDFQKLAEKRLLKKNGLGIRQLDAQATLGGAKVLTTTLIAASGNRSTVLNLISSAKDPKGHAAALKTVIGRQK